MKVDYFVEAVPPWEKGVWRRFVVVRKKATPTLTGYDIVSRHFTLSGAERKKRKFAASQRALDTFRGDL